MGLFDELLSAVAGAAGTATAMVLGVPVAAAVGLGLAAGLAAYEIAVSVECADNKDKAVKGLNRVLRKYLRQPSIFPYKLTGVEASAVPKVIGGRGFTTVRLTVSFAPSGASGSFSLRSLAADAARAADLDSSRGCSVSSDSPAGATVGIDCSLETKKVGDKEVRYCKCSRFAVARAFGTASDEYYFIGDTPKSTVIYIIAAVFDPFGTLVGAHVERVSPPTALISLYVPNPQPCPPSTLYSGRWYALPKKSWSSEVSFSVDALVQEGYTVRVWAVTPAFLQQLVHVCCGKRGARPSFCSSLDCSSVCETGYLLMPDVAERLLKFFGFYNEDVIKIVEAVANSGYLIGSASAVVPSSPVEVGDAAIKAYYKVLEQSGGAVKIVGKSVKGYGNLKVPESVDEVVIDAPAVKALYLGSTGQAELLIDPSPPTVWNGPGSSSVLAGISATVGPLVMTAFKDIGGAVFSAPLLDAALALLEWYGGTISVQVAKRGGRPVYTMAGVSISYDGRSAVVREAESAVQSGLGAVLAAISRFAPLGVWTASSPVIARVISAVQAEAVKLKDGEVKTVTIKFERAAPSSEEKSNG